MTKNIAFIADAIAKSGEATVVAFANCLQQHDLITQEVKDTAATYIRTRRPTELVVRQLMIPVQNKIKYIPEQYNDFLLVLRNSGLDFIAEKLEKDYCECLSNQPLLPLSPHSHTHICLFVSVSEHKH